MAFFDGSGLSLQFPKLLDQYLEKKSVAKADLTIKAIGPPLMLETLKQLLNKVGLNQFKLVSREDPFEICFDSQNQSIRVSKALEKEHSPHSPLRAVAPKKIRILIVDDSKPVRLLLNKVLSQEENFEVVGMAAKPSEADELIEKVNPDVITLDIHMPEMTGVDYLKKLLPRKRIPVIMVSSISMQEGTLVLEALQAGAVDYIQKPSLDQVGTVGQMMIDKVKQAASANVRTHFPAAGSQAAKSRLVATSTDHLIVVGSSTGGTTALENVLTRLPEKIPPILITQHIPAVFSKAFANRLNGLCPFEVKEAEDGELVCNSKVYVAPGGFQMSIVQRGKDLRIKITDDPPVNRFKPSVDYLYESVLKVTCRPVVAAILTGMGKDGAQGMLRLKNSGAKTIAQDEASCVVYGMPREAARIGAADKILDLAGIAEELLKPVRSKRSSSVSERQAAQSKAS